MDRPFPSTRRDRIIVAVSVAVWVLVAYRLGWAGVPAAVLIGVGIAALSAAR